jgi:endonuclease VIII
VAEKLPERPEPWSPSVPDATTFVRVKILSTEQDGKRNAAQYLRLNSQKSLDPGTQTMPEGHTIHRLALDHTRDLAGQVVTVESPQGRMADGAAAVNAMVLRAIDPYGKHLFYRFTPPTTGRKRKGAADTSIHVHLGLFGKFKRSAAPGPDPKDTVRMRITGKKWTVDLTGPTDCRIVSGAEEQTIRDRLGPDPIRDDADPDRAWDKIAKRRSTIGEALMDQKVMAGVGNVYRAEALFVNSIHPNRVAKDVTRWEFDALWSTIVGMLRQGVIDSRIITVADDELADSGVPRKRIRGKEAVYVYKKDHCRRCGTPIDRWDLSGRWAYACPTCQPS